MRNNSVHTLKNVLPGFLDYMVAERRFSPATVRKYRDNVLWFAKYAGNVSLQDLEFQDCISFKARMKQRGAHESRIAGIIFALKSLLTYGRDVLGIRVVDLKSLRAPKPPRREVTYLSNDEFSQFVSMIPLETSWTGQPKLAGYCFRALVETLAASAMRISEVLSLNRDSIDSVKREACIVGKGNKERTVFFTSQSMQWISRYLDIRLDSEPPLFATRTGTRLQVGSVEATFRRTSARAGLKKRVTPHIIRHTAATNLLHNGCPIGYIKEVLGHERLETTCRFYLGALSKTETKKAFDTYMYYNADAPQAPLSPP